MKRFLLATFVLALVGCAQPQQARKAAPVVNTTTPTCTTKLQCDRMWLAAQDAASRISGMRLRIVTDTRLETFAPTGYGRSGAIVVKYPMGGDAFEIRADFHCYGGTDCSDIRPLALNAFNLSVGPAR